MVTPDPFRRPPDGSLPRELPRNSLQLRILRITPLVTGFYADFRLSPLCFQDFAGRGRGEGVCRPPIMLQ
jgi:hypothetical protein